MKTQGLLLPALLIGGALVLRRISFRQAMLTGLLAYAACLAVIAPWTMRNWEVLGEPVLISTNGGFNLYMGNNPWNRWGGYMWPAPKEFMDATENLNILKAIPDEIALNAKLNRLAVDYIRDNPVEAAKRVPYKLYQFFRFDVLPLSQAEVGAKRNGQNVHALVATVAPLAEIWHWAMMWSAFLFPVLFWLARRPAEAALAASCRLRTSARSRRCSSGSRVSTCRCCRFIQLSRSASWTAFFNASGGLSCGPPEESMTALQTDERTQDAVPSAAVIGGGPAGLMAAEVMAKAGIKVEIFDTMPSVGRKFLLAGRGGLNLTHSEPLERFVTRYAERAASRGSLAGRFSPTTCGPGRPNWGSRPLSGAAAGCFPCR